MLFDFCGVYFSTGMAEQAYSAEKATKARSDTTNPQSEIRNQKLFLDLVQRNW
jgi:hypothetical protein